MKKLLIISLLLLASCKEGDIPFTTSELQDETTNALSRAGIDPKQWAQFKHEYRTPQGTLIKSVVPVPPDFLNAADEGRQKQIERFRQIFPNFAAPPSGTILLVEPNSVLQPSGEMTGKCVNVETEPGSPCVYVNGIKAAGTVLGADDRWEKLDQELPIVAPHQGAQNWRFRDYFVNTIHNENEHRAAFVNRTAEPTGVFYHFLGPNDAHPFQWGDSVGLVGPVKHYCGL